MIERLTIAKHETVSGRFVRKYIKDIPSEFVGGELYSTEIGSGEFRGWKRHKANCVVLICVLGKAEVLLPELKQKIELEPDFGGLVIHPLTIFGFVGVADISTFVSLASGAWAIEEIENIPESEYGLEW